MNHPHRQVTAINQYHREPQISKPLRMLLWFLLFAIVLGWWVGMLVYGTEREPVETTTEFNDVGR